MVDKTETKGATNPAANKGNGKKWEKEQVGFDPYWTPEEGKSFEGIPMGLDSSDPKFHRYQIMATEDTECQRGPNNEDSDRHEKVIVRKGETFNVSAYFSLTKLLNEYLTYSAETGKPVEMKVVAKTTVRTKSDQDCWLWDAFLGSDSKKAMTDWRRKRQSKLLGEGSNERPAMKE